MKPLRCEAGRPCSRHGGAQGQVLTRCTGPEVEEFLPAPDVAA